MTNDEWQTFFELVEKIVRMDDTWQNKRDMVRREAKMIDAGPSLDEFVGWYTD